MTTTHAAYLAARRLTTEACNAALAGKGTQAAVVAARIAEEALGKLLDAERGA